MESLLCVWVVTAVICAFLAAVSVPNDQSGFAGVLGFLLGPIGVLAAILISIRLAIEGEKPEQPNMPAPQGKPDLVIDDAYAYNNRGDAYANKGDYDKAIADYTEAIRLKPDYAYAYYGRGKAYAEKGDLDKAIADYTVAVRLKPDFAAAYYNRGLAYDRKGEKRKAEVDLAEAKRLGYS